MTHFYVNVENFTGFFALVYLFSVEFMIMQFKSRESTVPKLKNGLDCSKPDTIKLIRCVSRLQHKQQTGRFPSAVNYVR